MTQKAHLALVFLFRMRRRWRRMRAFFLLPWFYSVASVIKGFSLGLIFNYPITNSFLAFAVALGFAFDVALAKSQKPRANGLFFNYPITNPPLVFESICVHLRRSVANSAFALGFVFAVALAKSQKPRGNGLFFNYPITQSPSPLTFNYPLITLNRSAFICVDQWPIPPLLLVLFLLLL